MRKSHTARMESLEDVLYAFSIAKPIPDAELLEEFIRRYPEYTEYLSDFAMEIVKDSMIAGDLASPDAEQARKFQFSPSVTRAMSRFQNALYISQQKEKAESVPPPNRTVIIENPFEKLTRQEIRDLSTRIHANTTLVGKLRDRQIAHTTFSPGFQQLLAKEMKAPLSLVAAHLAAPPQVRSGSQFYKSEHKPEVGNTQTFEEAVKSSGLTEEQQRFLLSL